LDIRLAPPGSEAQALDALKLARLGGTYELYADAGVGDTYCLVGAASPGAGLPPYSAAETGSLESGNRTYPLRGVLGRGHRGNFFSPLASDALLTPTNFDFYSILAQPPAAFPIPKNDAEQTASDDIAMKLCHEKGCNPRDSYWNGQRVEDWELELALDNMVPESDPPMYCTPEGQTDVPYCVVWRQLLMELSYAAKIRRFDSNISQLWSDTQTNSIYTLLKTQNKIENELKADAKAPTSGLVENILKSVLSAGSKLPGIGPVFGVAYAAFSFSTSLANNDTGDSLVSGLSSTVADLEGQAVTSLTLRKQRWARCFVSSSKTGARLRHSVLL
jgi:hypothetical protein